MNIKKIGIVVADIDEYTPFKENINAKFGVTEKKYLSREGIEFVLNGTDIVCVFSGMGKVNAAAITANLIDNGCNVILNFGLSGGISGVGRGELSVPDVFLEHDFDLTPLGYKLCEKPGQDYVYHVDKKLLDIFVKTLKGAKVGCAVCGDRFISNEKDRDFFKENYNAMSCDMETAAIASVCFMAGVPFAVLRRISDDAGEDASSTYREMNTCEGDQLGEYFYKVLDAVSKEREI